MAFLKLILGIFFLLLGWIYLYKPNFVLSFNRIVRELLFNDRQILLARKKLAILYFCIAFITLYMGLTSLARLMEEKEKKSWLLKPYEYSMYIATQDYYSGRYQKALERYKKILAISPEKQKVLKCIAFTYISMGEKEKARKLCDKLLQINPDDQIIRIKLRSLEKNK